MRLLRERSGLDGNRGTPGVGDEPTPEDPTRTSTAGEEAAEASPEDVDPIPATDAPDTVRCRACGTANGAEYRFCRACVSELPGAGFALEPTIDASPRPF